MVALNIKNEIKIENLKAEKRKAEALEECLAVHEDARKKYQLVYLTTIQMNYL